jgi:hypothetical protein
MLGWDKSVKAGEPENDSPLMGPKVAKVEISAK